MSLFARIMGRDQFHRQKWVSGKPNRNRGGRGGGQQFKNRGQQSVRGRPGAFANNRRPKSKDPVAVSNVKEDQVYITEYVTAGDGFRGILKSRFSDFQVNEIDRDGKVAVLTDLGLPTPPVSGDKMSTEEAEQELSRLISQETVEKIQRLTELKGKCNDIVEVDVTEMTKEDRGRIHACAKGLFGKAIVGSTVTRNEKKYITFAAFNKFKKVDRREKWLWPHRFVYFLLYKENEDTIQATSQLAELLKCSPSVFAYAGTKDRRAITTQWVCVKQFDPRRIAAAAEKIKQLTVGNFCFKPETLKLGQLQGNRFRIALRQVTAEESAIRETMESFQEKGFINYFGLQRFGNSATVPTYKVGVEILKGNWKEAFYLILKPRENDHWYMKACREEYEKSRDPETALDKLSAQNRSIEKQLLTWLVVHKNDYKCAIQQIPRNVRLLYCHSYQSLIWNRVASRRLKEFGHRLIPGDLVYVDNTVEAELPIEDVTVEQQDNVTEVSEVNPEESTDTSYFKNLVKPLTEANIASEQYTIFDVVLPLPGYDITYPANETGQWYEEIMAEDGLSSEKLKGPNKKESLGGAYRKMMIKPGNLQWKFTTYNDAKETLIYSDLDKLRGKEEPDASKDGSHRALILDFQLPSSAYATMALREILKADTSALHQRTLEQEHSNKSDQSAAASVSEAQTAEDDAQVNDNPTLDEAEDESLTIVEQSQHDEPTAKKTKLE